MNPMIVSLLVIALMLSLTMGAPAQTFHATGDFYAADVPPSLGEVCNDNGRCLFLHIGESIAATTSLGAVAFGDYGMSWYSNGVFYTLGFGGQFPLSFVQFAGTNKVFLNATLPSELCASDGSACITGMYKWS